MMGLKDTVLTRRMVNSGEIFVSDTRHLRKLCKPTETDRSQPPNQPPPPILRPTNPPLPCPNQSSNHLKNAC